MRSIRRPASSAGVNVGKQESSGVELSLQGGDFTKNGLSFSLSYTYTDSRIKYAPISNGVCVLDSLNAAIEQYNSYTRACAGSAAGSTICGGGFYAGNASRFHQSPAACTSPIRITDARCNR